MSTNRLIDLVFGLHGPDDLLLDEGRLPEGWAEAFCILLGELANSRRLEASWYRRAVHAVHHVSFHLGFRYRTWAVSKGRRNPDVEATLGRLQLESELFFWTATDWDVPAEELPVVSLCLTGNPLLGSGPFDHALLERWKHDYRDSLALLQPRWRSSTDWNKWAVNAVRFGSFCLDVAFLSLESQAVCDGQIGLDPTRIALTIGSLSSHLPPSTVAVVRRWLCLCHLPRDSSGLPHVVSSDAGRTPIGVRSVSELTLQTGSE